MQPEIYVIGHRNPDTDSIAAAIACAELKRSLGATNVTAAMAGPVTPQTAYILERLQFDPPLFLPDVRPKVRDVLNRRPVTARLDMTLKDGLELLHRHSIRVLPIVDDCRAPVGVVSLLKLSEKYLVAGSDRKRGVDTSLAALAQGLDATFLTGSPADEVEHLHLFIGAMTRESFARKIDGYASSSLLILTGDRPSIQKAAIESNVRVLVVTGGFPVDEELLAVARKKGVAVLATTHDTATAAWLSRLSTPLTFFMEPKFLQVGVGEPLDQLRLKLLHSGEPAVVAVEEDGSIAGIATKSSLLTPVPYALILVDHNELSQAVPGAESVEIREIIDHHKLGNPPTNQPIAFTSLPVGSTCTVIAGMYRERGVVPADRIAALMMAGILSDTVILKSPTTTSFDREMVAWLEPLAGIDHVEFGRDIFSSCSGFAPHGGAADAVQADFKEFSAGETRFGIGQVEVVGFEEFHSLKELLRGVLRRLRDERRLQLAGLMVTDIYSETTLFLAEGMNELAHVMAYPQLEPHLYELKGVMSRKKQMVPQLLKAFERLA